MDKSEFMCVDKSLLSDVKKILFKQSNRLISVIWTLLCRKQWLRGASGFIRGHTDTYDAECSVHPNSSVVPENTKILHKLVLANCKLKLHEIAEKLKISEDSAWTFVNV